MSVVPGETALTTRRVLGDIAAERRRQDEKWAPRDYADGTGAFKPEAEHARARCEHLFANGHEMWWPVLLEEVYEALAEEEPAKLREELVQVAAVATAWIEAIDQRVRS